MSFDVGYCHFQCLFDTLMYLLEHYTYTLHIFTSPYGIKKFLERDYSILCISSFVLKSFHLHLFIDPHVMFNKYHVLYVYHYHSII